MAIELTAHREGREDDGRIVHGRIRTMDPAHPFAQAMHVSAGRVLRIGDLETLRALAPSAPVDEARGSIVPGFIDSHIHTLIVGLERRRLTISDAVSIAEVVERIRAWVEQHPDDDWIVIGAHFHAEDLAEGRLPDRRDLDPVSGGAALYLDRRTHDAIVNSEALRRARIDRTSADPPGGWIERGADGEPTGVLVERPAADLVFSLIPDVTRHELHAALQDAQRYLHGLGIVGAAEPGLSPLEMSVYQEARNRGELTLRTLAMPLVDTSVDADEYIRRLGSVTGFGDDVLRIGPLKVYFDGTGGFGTAMIDRDWPASPGYHGTQVCPTETFQALADHCGREGWSMAVHTVGGEAVRTVLDCFEQVDRANPIRDLRFSVMHGYLWPTEHDMRRAARLGVILSTQPAMQWRVAAGIDAQFGRDAAERTAPLRSWLDAGAVLAGGSDGPDFPMSPLFGMWQARTRHVRGLDEPLGPREALTADEALRLWTTDAAHYAFAEGRRGVLAAGALADWVELDFDPIDADPEQLLDIRVLRTVVGGRVVFALEE